MNVIEASGTKHFIKTLTEITVYTTTILGYVLALMGRVPEEFSSYSTTVATLTFLISLAVLWKWRWALIAKKRPHDSRILLSDTDDMDNRAFQPSGNHIWDPFSSSQSGLYMMSLGQRRLEGTFLLALTVCALGITGIRIPKIAGEFSSLHCLNNKPDALRVIIADFTPADSSQFEDSLANRIYLHKDVHFEICRYKRPTVLFVSDAENTGRTYKAALVIWGTNNAGLMDVYFTPTADWAISKPLEDGLIAKDSKNEVAFLAEQVASEILFFQGKPEDAQRNLSGALENSADLENTNRALLADGHFLLGIFFDPDGYPEDSPFPDLPRAITEYSNAIRLNGALEYAYLNRASLYKKSGDADKAITDYSTLILIAQNTDNQLDAYLQKADLLVAKQLCLPAIADLKNAFKIPEVEGYYAYPDMVHILGKAYLLCRDYTAAEKSYLRLTAVDAGIIHIFVEDLSGLVAENPENRELQEEVAKIIKNLEQ